MRVLFHLFHLLVEHLMPPSELLVQGLDVSLVQFFIGRCVLTNSLFYFSIETMYSPILNVLSCSYLFFRSKKDSS
jgi:hypothetical protein